MLRDVEYLYMVNFYFIFSVRITNYGTAQCLSEDGPGNEKWPVLKLTLAPFIFLFQIEHVPVRHWSGAQKIIFCQVTNIFLQGFASSGIFIISNYLLNFGFSHR